MFFNKNFGEVFKSQVRLIFIPNEYLFEPLAFNFNVEFNRYQCAKSIIIIKLFIQAIVRRLQKIELCYMHRVHSWLIGHEVL